jgi:hypothetical protein
VLFPNHGTDQNRAPPIFPCILCVGCVFKFIRQSLLVSLDVALRCVLQLTRQRHVKVTASHHAKRLARISDSPSCCVRAPMNHPRESPNSPTVEFSSPRGRNRRAARRVSSFQIRSARYLTNPFPSLLPLPSPLSPSLPPPSLLSAIGHSCDLTRGCGRVSSRRLEPALDETLDQPVVEFRHGR